MLADQLRCLGITPLKKDAQIYMPEENRPKIYGAEVAELTSIVANPEYRIVVTSSTPSKGTPSGKPDR